MKKKYLMDINIEPGNWFNRECDNGSKMWAFSTPSINFVKQKGFLMLNVMVFFWDLTIEIRTKDESN